MESNVETDVIGPNTTKEHAPKADAKAWTNAANYSIDPFSQIYKWAPMGIRITIATPYLGNDRGFLFSILVNPMVITPRASWEYDAGTHIYGNSFPVNCEDRNPNHPDRWDEPDYGPYIALPKREDAKVYVYHSGPEPLLSVLARSHRFWRGGISYQLRATTNFTHQGNLVVSRSGPVAPPRLRYGLHGRTVSGDTTRKTKVNTQNFRPPTPLPTNMPNTLLPCAFVQSDLSSLKHIEVTVPYELPYPYFDQCTYMDGMYRRVTELPVEKLMFSLKGGLSGGGTNEISYELYYKAEADFRMSCWIGNDVFITEDVERSFADGLFGPATWTFPNERIFDDGNIWSVVKAP